MIIAVSRLIASRRGWRAALLVALIGACALAWEVVGRSVAVDATITRPPVWSNRLVPLAGDALDAFAPEVCIPFAEELARHPNWQLQFALPYGSCTEIGYLRVLSFSDDDELVWDDIAMPTRRLALTAGERATLHGLAHISCDPITDDDHPDTWRVSIGELRSGRSSMLSDTTPRISRRSPMGQAMERVFGEARQRYVARRLAELGEVRGDLELRFALDRRWPRLRASDRVRLRGHRVEVLRGRHVRAVVALDDEQLVDLADWAQVPHDPPPAETVEIRGAIIVGGTRVAITVDFHPAPPLVPIIDAVVAAGADR
ncbi:MAG: hypothetical protein K8W52_30460 [Deltaproteobacteria bacterium]|nr:hypothetical protein [Deltaproteobacteria bacterium]